jgi:hypothetical protein
MAEPPAGQGVGGLTSEEEALRHACLKIQNDPRLSVSEKRRQVSALTGSYAPARANLTLLTPDYATTQAAEQADRARAIRRERNRR